MQKPDDVRKQLGERVRYLRKKHGWTQVEMAHLFGLDRTYVGEIEQGKRNPCLLTLKTLADGMKISMARLFSGIK